MPTDKPLSVKDKLRATIHGLAQAVSPPQPPSGLNTDPIGKYVSPESVTFDMSETGFAKQMNRFLESTSDSMQGLMDYAMLGSNYAPAQSGFVFSLAEVLRPGDTVIKVRAVNQKAREEWVLEEDRNRIGFIDPGTRVSLSSKYLEYTQVHPAGPETIEVVLATPVPRQFIVDYYEHLTGAAPETKPLGVPAKTVLARFEIVRNDDTPESTMDGMLASVESGLDVLNNAVDAVLTRNNISIACCLLRQLAALSNEGPAFAVYASAKFTPSDQVQEELQKIREFVLYARVAITFSLGAQGFSLPFMSINIYKILIDSMLISLSATLGVLYRNAKKSIYALAFGLLTKGKIVNCMPFYGFVRGLLAWLFSRKGILGWAAGFAFQASARMRSFNAGLNGLNTSLTTQINLDKLIHFLDSLIAATANMELCQDIFDKYKTNRAPNDITLTQNSTPAGSSGKKDPPPANTGDSGNEPDTDKGLTMAPGQGGSALDNFDTILDEIFHPGGSGAGIEDTSLTELEVTGAQALTLILQPSDTELENFMINRLGADPAVARDAVYRSKMGECSKGLNSSELSSVISALHDAGLEI